jgi:hypothetical protein
MNQLSENGISQGLDYRSNVLNQEKNLKYMIPISCLDKTSDFGIPTEVRIWLFS